MYLKSLSIKGFKSFANEAVLELEPGVTVVVGPNGSGKSNVVDALAWVLGAQAPSTIRSQKMDDVIFAGTATRAALGRAEVSITIDNTDGTLPIEFSEVQITRTLFRNGDSEYAINGVACRLLDISDLLSDSGVGRQQHIIVSQGQIDAVLNARPEERRMIIEEAAGVLKHRRRKERSERRLATTDDNLARLSDLVGEVERQLKPLRRQAKAAQRHGALVAELNALRLHLAGRELEAVTAQLDHARRDREELDRRDQALARRLADLDGLVLDGEAEVRSLAAADVRGVLARAHNLRERLRGQVNVVAERQRRLVGELQAVLDENVVANLEAEAARIATERDEVEAEQAALAPEFARLAEAGAALSRARAEFDRQWGAGVGPAPAEAAKVRAELGALRSAIERTEQERRRFDEQATALGERTGRLQIQIAALEQETTGLDTNEIPTALGERDRADTRRVQAEADLEDAVERRRQVDAEHHHWQARADALFQALESARSAAGVDALADSPGVLGTLLDFVDVDTGWEAAVEAAAGESLQVLIIDDVANGRAALESLAAGELTGAVLALAAAVTSSPIIGSGPEASLGEVGGSAQRLRSRVRATRADIEPLLDILFSSAVAVEGDWQEALDLALAHPHLTVVTVTGDRFGVTGWRLGQSATGATGAALEEATEEAERARLGAAEVAAEVGRARQVAAEARQHAEQAAAAWRALTQRGDEARAARDRAIEELGRLVADAEALEARRHEVVGRLGRDRDQLQARELQLPELEAAEAAHLARTRQLGRQRAELEEQTRRHAAAQTSLEVASAGISERAAGLQRRAAEIDARLVRLAAEREQAEIRRRGREAALAVVEDLAQRLTELGARLSVWIDGLEAEQRVQAAAVRATSSRLADHRRQRQAAEAERQAQGEQRSRIDVAETEARVRLESVTESLRRDLGAEVDEALAAPCPEMGGSERGEGVTPASRLAELERELARLGAINPLAVEEFAEVSARHEFLTEQLEDIRHSRRELRRLIREIDNQIVAVFSDAFADVATNFTELFTTLFPGGQGVLRLTDAEDLLHCGVEIEARPGGKNVKKLTLLSGGERALTALGFLFAVFRSRPSPFYVMDEVEAALDDINISRFLSLVEEFRKDAQLIIVSHQKRTMEVADVLYGVSMKPGGSSKVVGERVDPARFAPE